MRHGYGVTTPGTGLRSGYTVLIFSSANYLYNLTLKITISEKLTKDLDFVLYVIFS
jgi:hypothetical protein